MVTGWATCFGCRPRGPSRCRFFFFNDTATTEIYTLSLHDALPISVDVSEPRLRGSALHPGGPVQGRGAQEAHRGDRCQGGDRGDRKSTRLNSSHSQISYAVFCLKKKKRLHGAAGQQVDDPDLHDLG